MKFDDAITKYKGESVGGQLIVGVGADRLSIGKHVEGQFVPFATPEAEAYMNSADGPRRKKVADPVAEAPAAEPEPAAEPVVEPGAKPAPAAKA